MEQLLSLVPGIGSVINKVTDKALSYIPDPEQRAKAEQEIRQMDMQADTQQIAVNMEEAKSELWWKAGWRPFVGWVCGAAFGYTFFLQPLLSFFVVMWMPDFHPPRLDMDELMTVLTGLLGLSYHRSKDKKTIADSR